MCFPVAGVHNRVSESGKVNSFRIFVKCLVFDGCFRPSQSDLLRKALAEGERVGLAPEIEDQMLAVSLVSLVSLPLLVNLFVRLKPCKEMRLGKETLATEQAKAEAKELLAKAVRDLSYVTWLQTLQTLSFYLGFAKRLIRQDWKVGTSHFQGHNWWSSGSDSRGRPLAQLSKRLETSWDRFEARNLVDTS